MNPSSLYGSRQEEMKATNRPTYSFWVNSGCTHMNRLQHRHTHVHQFKICTSTISSLAAPEQTARGTTHFFIFSRMFAILPNRFCEDENRNSCCEICSEESAVTWSCWQPVTSHLSFLSDVQNQLELLWHGQIFFGRLLGKQRRHKGWQLSINHRTLKAQSVIQIAGYETNDSKHVSIKQTMTVKCLQLYRRFSYHGLRDFRYNAPLNPPASESSASWVQTGRYKVILYPGHMSE